MQSKYIVTRDSFAKVVLLAFSLFLVLFYNSTNISRETLCLLVIVNIVINIFVLKASNCLHLHEAKLYFWLITVVFSFGQHIAYFFSRSAFSMNADAKYFFAITGDAFTQSTIFTILGFDFLTLGVISSGIITIGNRQMHDYDEEKAERVMLTVSTVLLLLSTIPAAVYLYRQVILYITIGYGDIDKQMSGIIIRWHYLFIPALLMRIIAKVKQSKSYKIESIVLWFYCFVELYIGNRGMSLATVVAYLWIRIISQKQNKSHSIKKIIVVVIIGVIVLLLIPITKYYRSAYSGDFISALNYSLDYIMSNNPFLDVLMELGANFRILPQTMSKVASEGYANGATYLDFLKNMLPSIIRPDLTYGTLSKWLLGTTGYQTNGFSIWAEAYMNFGFFGIFILYFIGRGLKRLLSYNPQKNGVIQIFIVATSLHFFADIVRRSVSGFGYNLLYDILLPAAILYILTKSKHFNEVKN